MNEALITKIRALLRKGKDKTASPQEAKMFLDKAQELMTKYNIENLPPESQEDAESWAFSKKYIRTGRSAYNHERFLMTIIQTCFPIKIYYYTYADLNRNDRVVRYVGYLLVGEDLDMEVAAIAIEELHAAMRKGVFAHLRERGFTTPQNDIMIAFHTGTMSGYIDANAQGRRRAEAMHAKADVDRYALVLVSKKDALAVYADKEVDAKKSKEKRRELDPIAYFAGEAYGSHMDIAAGEGRIQ